jgi:hypothetical protein
METESAPCSSCVRATTHEVLFKINRLDLNDAEMMSSYKLLSCGGCATVCLMHERFGISDDELNEDEDDDNVRMPRGTYIKFYPSPVSRKEPDWLEWLWLVGDANEDRLVSLLREIYQAVDGGQHRLAAMGIRALLEQVMIAKIGDIGGFDKKLDAFQQAGFISLIQRDAMRATLDVGDAAMHRAFLPDRQELSTSLDIAEGVMSAIYSHRQAAEKLGDRVPPRKPRASGDKQG